MMTLQYAARAGHWRVRESDDATRRAANAETPPAAKFALGRLFVTPVALAAVGEHLGEGRPYSVRQLLESADHLALVMPFVARHANCDWGDVDADDWRANDDALREGNRLLSAYDIGRGRRLWILTEADRSATTVILASEY
jgi:hypothetical protein